MVVYLVECFTEVHDFNICLLTIFGTVMDCLCETNQLRLTAVFGSKTMLVGVKDVISVIEGHDIRRDDLFH